MNTWAFWLLVGCIPMLSAVLGAIVTALLIRGQFSQLRDEDYRQGYLAGRIKGKGEMAAEYERLADLAADTEPDPVPEADVAASLSAPPLHTELAPTPLHDQVWAELHRELAGDDPLITMDEARAEVLADADQGGRGAG